jgi:hypothetical protein
VAWSRGQGWRVAESLQTLNRQIRERFPGAVPPATSTMSWGSIADSAHDSESDHYPHKYDALGGTAVVCARDVPHAPRHGLDAHALAEDLRKSRDPRIGYIISNRRITGPNHGWQWARYSGSDPHDTHIHVSVVHTKAADDPRPWQIGDDNDMAFFDEKHEQAGGRTGKQLIVDLWWAEFKGNPGAKPQQALGRIEKALQQLGARIDDDPVDEQAVAAAVVSVLTPEVIARAIPKELAQQVVDKLVARLAT